MTFAIILVLSIIYFFIEGRKDPGLAAIPLALCAMYIVNHFILGW